jgi:two-component system sensor histidine kinase BaeS
LGLAICRSIVERHGGTIDVTSTTGRGTTFMVRLPMA